LAGSHQDQRQAICAAPDFAERQLSLVASAAGGEAAQILEFQVALLEDEEPSSCFVVARLTV
jgi:phosphotransferase system enzyme I (PtsI)